MSSVENSIPAKIITGGPRKVQPVLLTGYFMAEFQVVCRVDELIEGEGRTVEVSGKLIALFCDRGQYFAIDDVCPHMGASLSGGYLENGIVTCPWHAWRFRLGDGAWADNPRIKIGCFPVRVENGQIQVQVGGNGSESN